MPASPAATTTRARRDSEADGYLSWHDDGGIRAVASEGGGPVSAKSRRRSDRASRCMGLRVQLHAASAAGSGGKRRHHALRCDGEAAWLEARAEGYADVGARG